MSKSNTLESAILQLIFNATPIANIADNAASSPLTNLYVALHTGDPGETGNQSTNEVSYSGYARVAVARTTGGWTVSGAAPTSVSPVATIAFPVCSSGSATATHASVGVAASGLSNILYSGALTPSISITAGDTPRIKTDSTITED